MSPGLARLRPWLVIVGLALLALGTWRSFPVVRGEALERVGLRVLLFDLSAGTTRLRPAHSLWARARLREEAQRALAADEELAVGVYGSDVVSLGMAPASEWLERLAGKDGELLEVTLDGPGALGSELDAALGLFEAELSDRRRPQVSLVIAGARDYSGSNPRPRLARLAQAGTAIEWIDLPPARLVDVALEGLRLPANPAPGAPLVAELQLSLESATRFASQASSARQVRVHLHLESAQGVQDHQRILRVPAAPQETPERVQWSARVELGSVQDGRTALVAQVELLDEQGRVLKDPMPENDRLSARCRAGRTRVFAAVAELETQPLVWDWIGREPARWPGIQWLVVEPSELPSLLASVDVLVSVDLGPDQLPASLVEGFVRGGGGWLFCGAWGSLAGWFRGSNAQKEGLNGLLPLHPAKGGGAPRDVIVLVDGSGSMEGEPFERVREALAGLVASVPEEDALSLHFFTGGLRPAVDLRRGSEGTRAAVRRLFDARVPGGATAIVYSLESLVQQRRDVQREALVILLSDGKEMNSSNVAARTAVLRAELNHGESRLVVIAAGDDPDLHLLGELAGEQPVLRAGDLDTLAEIFQREVFARRVREGSLSVASAKSGRLQESVDLLAGWGSAESAWPDVQRYLRCEASAQADVLLRATASGEPLIAWQRVGRGMVCAWASAPVAGWSAAYAREDARVAALLRRMAALSNEPVPLQMEWTQERLLLTNVPLDWPAELEAVFHAQLPGLLLESQRIELELARCTLSIGAPQPGLDLRSAREGALPLELVERGLGAPLSVILRDPGDATWLGQAGLDLPIHAEYRRAGKPRVDLAGLSPASPARGALAPRPDPRAWIWLALGICLLSAASLLGALGKRPPVTA